FKTPTACAAFLCETVGAFRARCDQLWHRLATHSIHALDREEAHVRSLAARTATGARTTVELGAARVDSLRLAAARAPERTLVGAAQHVGALAREVRALDPARVVARGWSITRTADGQLVRRLDDAPPGTALHTTVADGTLESTVASHVHRPGDPSR